MKKTSGILCGIALVAIGVILALNALGITDINIFFDGWWTLFFIIPSLIGLISERDKTCSIVKIHDLVDLVQAAALIAGVLHDSELVCIDADVY